MGQREFDRVIGFGPQYHVTIYSNVIFIIMAEVVGSILVTPEFPTRLLWTGVWCQIITYCTATTGPRKRER